MERPIVPHLVAQPPGPGRRVIDLGGLEGQLPLVAGLGFGQIQPLLQVGGRRGKEVQHHLFPALPAGQRGDEELHSLAVLDVPHPDGSQSRPGFR